MQGVGLVLAFGASVFLAKVLGAGGLGQFSYVMAMVAVLSVVVAAGLPTVVARLISVYEAKAQWGLANGLLRWAGRRIAAWALLIAALFVAYGILGQEKVSGWLYLFAAPLIPVLALTNLRQRALQALHCPIAAQLPEQLIKHTAFLLLGGVLVVAGSDIPKLPQGAMALWLLAGLVSLSVGTWLLAWAKAERLERAPPEYRASEWCAIASSLFLAETLGVLFVNTDTLLLGLLRSSEEVGVYQIALRLSSLLLVFLGASNWVLAPWFARFHAREERERFQSVVTRSSRIVFLVTLSIFGILVVVGEPLLGLFFGQTFEAAYPLMLILGVGHLVNVASGPVVNLLAMSGGQKELAWGVGICTLANLVLCGVLIPQYGTTGAAISVAMVTSVYNLLLAMIVKRKIGIRPTVFG